MHHTDLVIAAFVDDMRFLQQKALRDGFSANQWRHFWGWNAIALAHLEAAAQRTEPQYPRWAIAPYQPIDTFVDAQNAAIDGLYPEWDAPAAQRAWADQCETIIRVASDIPADIRADTTLFPFLNGSSVNDVLRIQTGHSREHYEKNAAEEAVDDALYALRQQYHWWAVHRTHPGATAWQYTHLWAWQTISLARLRAGHDGGLPRYPTWPTTNPDDHAAVDINAWIEQTHGVGSLQSAFERWDEGFTALLHLCADIPVERFVDPAACPWLDGYVLLDVITGSTEHHREHADEEL
jgi:hypothetical protein